MPPAVTAFGAAKPRATVPIGLAAENEGAIPPRRIRLPAKNHSFYSGPRLKGDRRGWRIKNNSACHPTVSVYLCPLGLSGAQSSVRDADNGAGAGDQAPGNRAGQIWVHP